MVMGIKSNLYWPSRLSPVRRLWNHNGHGDKELPILVQSFESC